MLAHTGRPEVREAALQVCRALQAAGLALRLLEGGGRPARASTSGDVELAEPAPEAAEGCELVVVVGGDGTILRAAELGP